MGEDKGAIDYHGSPQAAHLYRLLSRHCERALVSISAAQSALPPYDALPVVVDVLPRQGPATGLLSAARAAPGVAWLVVAVDLVRLDDRTLAVLIGARQPGAAATVYRHANGMPEPLCAIWEPAGLALLGERVARGDASPRRCLQAADVKAVCCESPEALVSVNEPGARDGLKGGQRRG